MARIRIDFVECLQDSQELGSDDEHMVSRILFLVNVNGRRINGRYHVDLKQAVGGPYELVPIEVGNPCDESGQEYKGPPWNYTAFRNEVERAYRRLFGAEGTAVRFSGGGLRMRSNLVHMGYSVEFDAEDRA